MPGLAAAVSSAAAIPAPVPTVPVATATAAFPTSLVLLGAAAVGGFLFLPGWAKIAVPAGLVGLLVAGNWSHCSSAATSGATQVMDQTTGQYLAQNVPGPMGTTMSMGCPTGHTCVSVPPSGSVLPDFSCLFSLFPGGL